MKAFLCELILSCVIASPGAKPLDELTYGGVLYNYYQDDYQQALLDTMVAEAQGRLGEDPVRFELAKGSFAFSDGMYELARQTFAGVDPAELTELDKMRLAFHLAREYHRRGDYAGMSTELAHIEFDKTWLGRARFHPEVEFMRAEAAMVSGQHAQAEMLLGRLDTDDSLLAYGLFNLGIAYRESDDLPAARRVFERLTTADPENDEARDLVHRAKLALAYIARELDDPADAANVLGGLPGEGRYRDIALASFGGLAMDNEDYELAARIWLTLQNQQYWSSSTAQARLAFPVSLERLASREMALEQYRQAERSFEARLAVLTTLNQQAENPSWVHSLLLVFSSPERDDERMADLVERWRDHLGHTDWLEWLATEDIHQVLLEWRELLTMQDWLDLLPAELAAFEEVAQEQRRRSSQARALLHDEALLENRLELQRKTDEQAELLRILAQTSALRTDEWMSKLASPEQRLLLDRFAAMRNLASARMTGDEQKQWLRRIERLNGVIFWTLVDESAGRIRHLENGQRSNASLLAEVDARIERVQQAEGQFVAGVETDFLAFNDRADELRRSVDTALDHREVALAHELRRGMAREMQEVQKYLLITRVGIARATDQLSMDLDVMEGE
jgi:hypothetical protein